MDRTMSALALPVCLLLAAPPARSAAAFKPDSNAPRSAVPEKFRWDLSALVPGDEAWEPAFAQATAALSALAPHKGQLSAAPAVKTCLEDYFTARQRVEHVASYANLKADEDDGVAKYQEWHQRALDLGNRLRSESAFIRLELLRLDDAAALAILADPSLAPYRAYVTDLRRRRTHLLGDEAEKVLSLAGDNLWSETDLNEIPSDIELAFKAMQKDIQLPKIKDEAGKPVQLTLANYGKYRASKDRRVRRDTVEGFFAALKKNEDVLAAVLGGETKRDVFLARARGYPTSVAAYLDRQDVPTEVVDKLIAAVHDNLQPLRRYVELRKKLLGLKDLHIYDLYPPIVPAAKAEIPYEDGLRDVLEALKPLGPDYVSELSGPSMLGRRMADVYPNKGKDSGAFSHSIWDAPPLVLLNYQDDIEDVSTTAHELGHAMHSLINSKAQPYPDAGYSSLTAEIASTFNEMLLAKHLLAKSLSDDKMRLYLLGRLVESIRTTIYRQTLFTEFELKLHGFAESGTPITPELLDRTYADLVRLYYGPGFALGPNDGVEWSYIPHFYWKHYVFSYACGLASGIALSERVATGDVEARGRYLAMLAQPREAHPVEILKDAGVDLLKPEAVQAAARLLDETITEMERLAASPGRVQ
ncbi:MAG: oligoendopeptidase F family protein [Elusimicrobia bacterium]|nr:oligoendopeptidase F family protein [Elusimicrobiota bacterium]